MRRLDDFKSNITNVDLGAQVYPKIIIGSLETAINLHKHNPHNVNVIINLSKQRYVSTMPVLHIDIDDVIITDDNIDFFSKHFAIGIDNIKNIMSNDQSNIVLVHCAQGVNRSATLIALYLISCGCSYEEVCNLLQNANNIRGYPLLTNYSFKQLIYNTYITNYESNFKSRVNTTTFSANMV